MKRSALFVLAAWVLAACGESDRPPTAPPTGVSLAVAVTPSPTGATVDTDREDYAPGELVTIVGKGWAPGETLLLSLTEDPVKDGQHDWQVTADDIGSFTDTSFSPGTQHIGVTFTLTATGTASGTSVAIFLDGNIRATTTAAVATTVTWKRFNTNSVCSGTPNNTDSENIDASGTTILTGVDAGQSLEVTVPATVVVDDITKTFDQWTDGTASKGTRTACLPGSSSNQLWTARYLNPSALTALSLAALSPASVTQGSTGPVSLSATLTSGGDPVGGATINFTIDGTITAGSATTLANGTATLSTYNPQALTVGNHTVNASFAAATINSTPFTGSTSGTQTLTVTSSDQTPPVITPTVTGTLGTNGWYTSNVSVSWSVVDGESSVTSTPCATTSITTDTDGQTVTCNATSAGGTASQSVTIKLDKTAPTISAGHTPAAANAEGWYKTDVVVHFTCSDAVTPGSGLAPNACPVDQTLGEGANQSASGTVTDQAGNSASASVTGINVDKTPPTVSATQSPPANAAGWNKADVTVSFSGSDALSGLVPSSCTAAVTISSETSLQSVPGSCADKAGNVGSATATVKLDKTAPTITGSWMPAPNSDGWNNSEVTVSFACGDLLSGIATCTEPPPLGGDGAGQSVTGNAVDKAGNSASATVIGINIDRTAPVVSVTGVTQGAVYTLGSVPAAGCSTTDALSGVATSATMALSGGQTVGGGTVGQITASCTGAADKAGNPGSKSVTYYVTFAWTGFFQPVDNGPVLNGAKAGSAIPVKFSLGGNQGLSIFASGYPKVAVVTCSGTTPVDPIEETVAAGNSSLTYDAVAGQYVYVWKTDKAWTGTCRALQVKLADDTPHTAYFQFK